MGGIKLLVSYPLKRDIVFIMVEQKTFLDITVSSAYYDARTPKYLLKISLIYQINRGENETSWHH